jgi:hypothetical protein
MLTVSNISYVDSGGLLAQGELVVKVAASRYNVTSMSDAMIHSAALTAQNSGTGANCHDQQYEAEQLKKRRPLGWSD